MFGPSIENEYLLINDRLLKILSALALVLIVLLRDNLLIFERQHHPPVILDPALCDKVSILASLVLDPTPHRRTTELLFVTMRGILSSLDYKVLHRNALVLVARHNEENKRPPPRVKMECGL